MHKLIRSEFVGIVAMAGGGFLGLSAIPKVSPPRPFVRWTDPVTPVVAVSKTAAGKTNYRRFDLAHFVNQFLANAIDVWNLRVGPNPDAIVDHAAKVLGEVSIKV